MFRTQSLKRSRDDDGDLHPLGPKKIRPWQGPASNAFSLPVPESADIDQALRFRAPTLTPIDSSDEEDVQNINSHALYTGTATKVFRPKPSNLNLDLNANLNQAPAKILLSGDDLSPWQQAYALNHHENHNHKHPSPIPHALVNHSLDINASALTAPGFGHDDFEPTPALTPAVDTPMEMEDITPFNKEPPIIRLPSPVSDTDMAMGDTMSDTELVYPGPYPTRVPTPGLDYGNVSPHPVAAHPMSRSTSDQSTTRMPTPCPIPHRRSALVMGYRADCDKCRCKVPGHYSHIIQRA
ncbi:hypothetical protein N7509_007686 [Penicillium cosmopolitanum]|uniref:Uncharacterized protein n=1 Tax=Penicillium cosmopolitanum TaxID=1131564 RepID=A0A9X0B8P2_9EURO|nr:uncharacterized protein N7509_007686 [Penicillium cosmopolitanum]KAJ5392196.1 hypothetical protein N7509_007686 [Penicillium cosmopolitanum]